MHIMQEAEAGTMYMFCKEMKHYLSDSKTNDAQISMAFTMNLVEGHEDPTYLLKDLTGGFTITKVLAY
jgi:hypothetical protein